MTTKINKANFFAKMGVLHREPVSLSGFGEVFIKALTAKENEEFEQIIVNSDGKMKTDISVKAVMVIKSAEDADGNKLFTMDDLEQLSEMPAAPINKMFAVASRLNNVTDADIEELTKN